MAKSAHFPCVMIGTESQRRRVNRDLHPSQLLSLEIVDRKRLPLILKRKRFRETRRAGKAIRSGYWTDFYKKKHVSKPGRDSARPGIR